MSVSLQWPYNEFVAIAPSPKATNEFVITVRKKKGTSSNTQMTFSSDYRADIITETLVSVYVRGGDGEAPEAVSVVEVVAAKFYLHVLYAPLLPFSLLGQY